MIITPKIMIVSLPMHTTMSGSFCSLVLHDMGEVHDKIFRHFLAKFQVLLHALAFESGRCSPTGECSCQE
uniref:Uncharacterized protein n=1 Tax=Physcomitrium patens TaxID=3218 RepID=A0A2K1L004_PHYPA|nr:hypothetical protein PHYPA_002143 [Physcomitrium patens]